MKKFTSPFILIKDSFNLFTKKANFLFLIQVYLPIGVLALVSLLFVYIPFLENFFAATDTGKILTLVFNLLFVLVLVFVNLAGIIAIKKILDGASLKVGKVFAEAISKYKMFLPLTIIIYLIYILSLVLFVIPLIFTTTWFCFSRFIVVERGKGIKMALSESRKLVKGNFWRVFFRILVFAIFYLCSQIILSTLPYGSGVVVFNLIGALYILPLFKFYREISSES